jgi:hypothetical protein
MICTAAAEGHIAGMLLKMQEEISSRSRRSAIAILAVEADNRVPSAHDGGADGAKGKAITRAAVTSCRNGMAGPPA